VSQVHNRPAPALAEVEAPPALTPPALLAPEVLAPVTQHPGVSTESPSRGQRSTVKLASVSPSPFRVQSQPPNAEGASESQAVGVALRKLRQSHDARGALEAAQWIAGKKGFYEFGEIAFG